MKFLAGMGLAAAMFGVSSLVCAAAPRYELSFDTQTYSAAMPIDQLLNKLRGDAPVDGRFAFTHNQVLLTKFVEDHSYSLGLRYDYFIRHSPDAAAFFYRDQQGLPFMEGERFDIRLQANHLQSIALGGSKAYRISAKLSGRLGLHFLFANRTLNGSLNGVVTIVENGYQADAHLDYFYSRDVLLERRPEPVNGYGLTADFDLQWDWRSDTRISLQGRDVLSGVLFPDVTYSIFDATTDTVGFDDSGRINSTPTLQGVERKRDEIQQLPERYRLTLDHGCSAWVRCELELFSYAGYVFPRLGFSYAEQRSEREWQVGYDFRANAVLLGLATQAFGLELRFDTSDARQARAVALKASWRFI